MPPRRPVDRCDGLLLAEGLIACGGKSEWRSFQAFHRKVPTSIEVINNNRKPYWLNKSNIPEMSVYFARCEFDCGVTLTHANYWIISVDSSTNPSESLFNHFEDAKPPFRHMFPHSPVHARSRANFIKRASQRPKFCTEARDSFLKPAHTIGSRRSSPEVRSLRSPWFSRPAIAASRESHVLSHSACFEDLIIRGFGG